MSYTRELYDNLRKIDQGFTRSYDEFMNDMQNEHIRKQLYASLNRLDPSFTRTYDEFNQDMNFFKLSEGAEKPQQAAKAQEQPFDPAKGTSYEGTAERYAKAYGVTEETKQQYNREIDFQSRYDSYRRKGSYDNRPEGTERYKIGKREYDLPETEAASIIQDALDQGFKAEEIINVGESRAHWQEVAGVAHQKREEAKKRRKEAAQAKREYIARMEEFVGNPMNIRNAKEAEEFKKRYEEFTKSEHYNPTAYQEASKERDLAVVAERTYRDAERIAKEGYRNVQGFAAAGRGLGQELASIDTWDLGISDLRDAAVQMGIDKKLENNEELTASEEDILNALALNAYVSDNVELSKGYEIGKATGQSVAFMITTALAPTSGMTSAIQRGGVKMLVNAGAKGAMKKFGKFGIKTVEAVAKGLTSAGTSGLAMTATDAINRYMGDVTYRIDDNGYCVFTGREGGVDAAQAIRDAYVSQAISYFTEAMGFIFDPLNAMSVKLVTKVGRKIAPDKLVNALARAKGSVWAEYVDDFFKLAGWHEVLGEFGEEQLETILNALLVGDSSISDLFNPRQQAITFGSVALMGGVISGIKTVGYRSPAARSKSNMKLYDKQLGQSLGEEWEGLRSTIEGDEDKALAAVRDFISNPNNSATDKKDVLGYYFNMNAYRGGSIADAKRKMEGEVPAGVIQAINAYSDAHYAAFMQDIDVRKVAKAYEELAKEVDVDFLNAYGDNIAQLMVDLNKREMNGEDVFKEKLYINAKAKYEGMMQGIQDRANTLVSRTNTFIDKVVHQNGNVVIVKLGDGSTAYVQEGNIVFKGYTEKTGNILDTENSSETLVVTVVDKNGKTTQKPIPASEVSEILSVEAPDAAKAASEQSIRGSLQAWFDGKMNEASDEEVQAATMSLEVGQIITLNTPSGTFDAEITGTNGGEYDLDFGTPVEIDGVKSNRHRLTEAQIQTMLTTESVEALNDAVEDEFDTQEGQNNEMPTEEAPVTGEQAPNEEPEGPPAPTEHVVDTEAASEPQKPLTQTEQDVADAEEMEAMGDTEYISANLAAAEKALEKANKKKPKSTDKEKRMAELQAINEEKANAQAEVDRWKAAQQALAEIRLKRTMEGQKQAGGSVENAHTPAASVAERWNNATKIDGHSDVRTLPDGTQIKGHYVLTTADAATPSHNPFNGYATSEGFPLNERGQNVNDRDYKADKSAQAETERIARKYGGQALENVPTISPEGVVYDGNGRTMAGQLAAANETDTDYNEALKQKASMFGFTQEQVESIPHARVVFVTDEVLPYTTETFAQFNKSEKKSQSGTETAVAKSKSLSDTVRSQLLSIIDTFDSLQGFFASERGAREVLSALQNGGVITFGEVAALVDTIDGKEVLSNQGKDFVTNVLLGSLFSEEIIRLMGNDRGLKQSILRALPSIIENRKLNEYALTENIEHAIRLLYEARVAGISFKAYLRQGNMFDGYVSDRYSAFEILLAEEMSAGVEQFREVLGMYNRLASAEAGGQLSMFEQRTPETIKQEILDYYGKERNQTGQQANDTRGKEGTGTKETEPAVHGSQEGDGQKVGLGNEGENASPYQQIESVAKELSEKLGVKVTILTDRSQVKNPVAQRAIDNGQTVEGWFEKGTGEVYLYAPNIASAERAQEVVVHEVVAHKGLGMLFGEEKYNQFLDAVWEMMSERERASFLNYVGDPKGEKGQTSQRHAADEYVAKLSEKVDLTKAEQTIWDKIVDKIKELMESLGFRMSRPIIEAAIRASYARLVNNAADNSQKTDNQGNPIDAEGKLITEQVQSIAELTDEDFTNPSRSVQLPALPNVVDAAIGANGKPVIIKKNVFEKNNKSHKDLTPKQSREILEAALYSPNLYGQNQAQTRPYNWILIHNGEKHSAVIIEVANNKDNLEIVNWHYLDDVALEQKYRQAEREGGLILTLESASGNNSSSLSADKSKTKTPTSQTNKGDFEYKLSEDGNHVIGKYRTYPLQEGVWLYEHSDIFSSENGDMTDEEKAIAGIRNYEKDSEEHFDWMLSKQEKVAPTKSSSNGKLKNITSPNNSRDFTKGVIHREGYAMAFNGPTRLVVAEKGRYDAKQDGKMLVKTKNGVEAREVVMPDWKKAMPTSTTPVEINMDELRGIVNTLKKNATVSQIAIRMPNGRIVSYDVKELKQFLDGAARIGATELLLGEHNALYVATKNGFAIVMPMARIIDINGDYYAYEAKPTTESKLEGKSATETKPTPQPAPKTEYEATYTDASGEEIFFSRVPGLKGLNKPLQLKEGEFCHVERMYTETKEFNFLRGHKIESAADVAFIFKSLENEAIENAFVVAVKGGEPVIVHAGMGDSSSSTLDVSVVINMINQLNPDAVYFVHNHPSGTLISSGGDRAIWNKLHTAIGSKLQEGIIINTTSGKYLTFNGLEDIDRKEHTTKEDAKRTKVYRFNKLAFHSNEIPPRISHQEAVAEFVSTQRLGARAKINALILNRQLQCIGNILVPATTLDNANAIAQSVIGYAVKMNGSNVILYGSANFASEKVEEVKQAIQKRSASSVELLDAITIESKLQEEGEEQTRFSIAGNINSGFEALQRLADGEEVVMNAMHREDLQEYGGDPNVNFYLGVSGDANNNYKGGYGILHIASKHGFDSVFKAIDLIANAPIKRYVDGNKTVIIGDTENEVVLALTRFGNRETWVLSGWKMKESAGETSEVSTQTSSTQTNPTFSREDLGAALAKHKGTNNSDTSNTLFSIANNEQTAAMNAKQAMSSTPMVEMDGLEDADVLFSITKNNKQTIQGWLNKRSDLSEEEKASVLDYIANMEVEGVNNNTLQLATGRWFANGTIRLPEDQDKVVQAVKVAEKKKANVLQYRSPMEVIETLGDIEVKEKPINPDEVTTLHIAKRFNNGLAIYDVDDSQESRENMRRIINTHFGKESSPWCLLQGDGEGNLTEVSTNYWYYNYNAYPKQVAFMNGKLVAFSANNREDRVWWDRQNEKHDGIPVIGKIKGDELGRSGTMKYNPESGEQTGITSLFKGDKQNGLYQEWYDNGQLHREYTYKNGRLDGLCGRWYENGQLEKEATYKDGKRDGLYREWYKNGQLKEESTYKDGKNDGVYRVWMERGQQKAEISYKDGKIDGVYKEWYSNGQLKYEDHYKDDKLNGLHRTWFENGQLKYESTYKDGKRVGLRREWYENGQLREESTYKDGKRDGLVRAWDYYSGKLFLADYYVNGERVPMPADVDVNAPVEQTMFSISQRKKQLSDAERFIEKGLDGNKATSRFTIDLPKNTERKVRLAMGRDFDSHSIEIGGIRHALKNHGVKGKKLTNRSIPIRKEDASLIPYIMVAPDYVRKGSTDTRGRESIQFYKQLSNGYVVVIEKEWFQSEKDLETINMWAEKGFSNAALPMEGQVNTSETVSIGRNDAAKIRSDAEAAIEQDVNNSKASSDNSNPTPKNTSLDEVLFSIGVYHNSPYLIKRADGSFVDPETGERLGFDHRFMGTGAGNQSHGWGSYFTVDDVRFYADVNQGIRAKYKGMSLIGISNSKLPPKEQALAASVLNAYLDDKNGVKSIREAIRYNIEKWGNSLLKIEKLVSEGKAKQEQVNKTKEVIEAFKSLNPNDFWILGDKHNYTVDIPDNNGWNYIEEFKRPTEEQIDRVVKGIANNGKLRNLWVHSLMTTEDGERFSNYAPNKVYDAMHDPYYDWESNDEFAENIEKLVRRKVEGMLYGHEKKNFEMDLYNGMSEVFIGFKEEAISNILSEIGFTGINYYAPIDGECYVIFNENDAVITSHTILSIAEQASENGGALFSIVTDPKLLEQLESGPVEHGFRTVATNADGSFGSPMAGKLGKSGEKSRSTTSFGLNMWEQADENPDMADDNGKINLIKPNGRGSVGGVDYNPYIHIRPDAINKQFTQAWMRPELVYVETAYPVSELESGYKADKAKLSVGRHAWNGGDLILSRYDRPERVIPWEEVADAWANEFAESGVTFDIVNPPLLPLLKARGIDILPPKKAAGKAAMQAYEAWKNGEQTRSSITEKSVENVIINETNGNRLPSNRTEAFEYIPANGVSYHNADQDVDIRVSRNAVKHSSLHNNSDSYAIFSAIERIIENAIKIGNVQVAEDEIGHTHAVSIYYVPVNVKGNQYSARLVVKEYENKGVVLEELSLYNVSLHKEKDSAVLPLSASNEVGGITAEPKSAYKVKDLIHNSQEADKKMLGIESQTLFSKVTPEMDAEYMDAVKRGDMQAAQRMVDEAARMAGYNVKAYHGTPNGTFTVFYDWQYFTEDKDYADVYQAQGASSNGYKETATNPKTYGVFLKIDNPFDTRNEKERNIFYKEFYRKRGNGVPLDEKKGVPDWTDGDDLVEFFEEKGYGYDALFLDEGGVGGYGQEVIDRGISLVIKNSSQIKSSDPVTYDNSGDVIPLSERFNPEREDIRFSMANRPTIEQLNAQFNEQLQQQIDGTLPSNHTYELGRPSAILRSAGIPDLPIELRASRLADKSMQENHPFELSEAKGLVEAIHNPLAVFRSATHVGSNVVLTELKHGNRNFVVAMRVLDKKGKLQVNDIRSLHYRQGTNIVGWINEGLADYIKPTFVEEWFEPMKRELLSKPQYNSAEVRKQLSSAANIVENFENPKLPEENNENVRFSTSPATGVAKQAYQHAVEQKGFQRTERWLDQYEALRLLQDAVEKELGRELRDNENAHLISTAVSSKTQSECEKYERDFFRPMMKAVKAMCKVAELTQAELETYMMAKHGLERQNAMAFNAALQKKHKPAKDATADEIQQARDNYRNERDQYMADFRALRSKMLDPIDFANELHQLRESYCSGYNKTKTDYAGLTGLTGKDKLSDAITAARRIVYFTELDSEYAAEELWTRVRMATKSSLRKSYQSGFMTRERFNDIASMYDFYVPLRGWNEQTAADAYEYFMTQQSIANMPLRSAEGRSSMADSPLATIGNMAESSISLGNKNIFKQHVLAMAEAAEQGGVDLLHVQNAWLERQTVNGQDAWVLSLPPITQGMTPDEIEQAIADHERDMKAKEKNGDAMRDRQGLRSDYRVITPKQVDEHGIVVYDRGVRKVVYINGNPRAAQAVNGLLNPDGRVKGAIQQSVEATSHFLAANFTTRNPEFIASNMARDIIFARTSVAIKENWAYNKRFNANLLPLVGGIAGATKIGFLLVRYNKGTLDMSKEDHRLFKEFMENGARTGYHVMNSVDDYKHKMRALLGHRIDQKTWFQDTLATVDEALKVVGAPVEFMNACAELVTRFAVYKTSRQMGRSVARSTANAKDVTVNFNRKGTYEGAAQIFKSCYLFWNAAMQSLYNLNTLRKTSPVRFTGAILGTIALGAVIPITNALISAMMDGGDDDDDKKNKYYDDLPDYVRRTNLCVYVGEGKFVTIPLPHELRSFYGVGEIMTQWANGKMKYDNVPLAITESMMSMMPIDPTTSWTASNGGVLDEDWALNLMATIGPDATRPIFQLARNQNFFGAPIYKEWVVDEAPKFQKAYNGTGVIYMNLAKSLNEMTGGDEYTRGKVDLNPAAMEHIIEAYLGGRYKFVSRSVTTANALWNSDTEMEWRNVPILNRFYKDVFDSKTEHFTVNRAYYHYYEMWSEIKHREKGYAKDIELTDDAFYEEEIARINRMRKTSEEKQELLDALYKRRQEAFANIHLSEYTDRLAELQKSDNYPIYKAFDEAYKDIQRIRREANDKAWTTEELNDAILARKKEFVDYAESYEQSLSR